MAILLDSSNICHISAHTFSSLHCKTQHTGVIYGFLKQIINMAITYKTKEFVFCWDSDSSIRKTRFAGYKYKRHSREGKEREQYEAFKAVSYPQFDQLKDSLLRDIGFRNIVECPGYEADDIIATYVLRGLSEPPIVVSSDKDFYQLLNNCMIYSPQTKKEITKDTFEKEYKINPNLWSEVLSLAGCTTDEVPGVPGIGPKWAVSYLTKKVLREDLKSRMEKMNKRIIRNRWLVTLPLPGITVPDPSFEEQFSLDNFVDICESLELYSFLKAPTYGMWRRIFKMR